MSTETSYHIKIEGPGLNLEKDVPEEVGKQIVVLVLTGTSPTPQKVIDKKDSLESGGSQNTGKRLTGSSGSVEKSVREFLDETEAKRSPDKITAIGCFLKNERSVDTLNREILKQLFEEAAEPVPKNLGRDIKWAIRIGWISEKSGSKGEYYVTNNGMDAVGQKFPKELKKRTALSPSKGKRTAKEGKGKDA